MSGSGIDSTAARSASVEGGGSSGVDADGAQRRGWGRVHRHHPRYKWVALSNTTLGMTMATINSSIVLISLPAIFRGIDLDPLDPANVSYLLWMLLGFLLATAVLVVMFGRLGDIYGRVRIYNLGFFAFALSSVALSLVPWSGSAGALWLIGFRAVQAVGAAMLMANATAILTDAFPLHQRGTALGINQVAAIAGSFLGLVVGGVLSEWHWRAVFWVSVPFGIIGAIWSYLSLHEVGARHKGRIDIPGNLTFALGLGLVLTGVTYGIQPYGGSTMGWGNPWVVGSLVFGLALLAVFVVVERRSPDPMFRLSLFGIRAFSLGNLAGLMASIARGGLQFILIIWLQGIWLPRRGYSYESTPLWASVFLVPLTVGFLAAGPLSGYLSDRYGARRFAVSGALLSAASFGGLMVLPVDFAYPAFAVLIFLNGVGSGMFSSPNASMVMNSVPAAQRGVASGMRMTFFNSGSALSIGVFFSLMVVGLATTLPGTLTAGLTGQGVPTPVADGLAGLPPVGILFAAFLGINPIAALLAPTGVLATLPASSSATLTGNDFFPSLISAPFHDGLVLVFAIAGAMMLVAAVASWYASTRPADVASRPDAGERLGEEPETYAPVEGEPADVSVGPIAAALGFPSAESPPPTPGAAAIESRTP
jgi:MFS family permease